MAQLCDGEVERGLTIRERAHDARPPSDLAQDALERVVGANPPPMLLRETVVGECLLDAASTSSAALTRRRPRSFSITRTVALEDRIAALDRSGSWRRRSRAASTSFCEKLSMGFFNRRVLPGPRVL